MLPWKEFNAKCYQLIDQTARKWEDAKKKCHILGAHLPIITSRDENKFVLHYAKQSRFPRHQLWLGMSRRADDTFKWVDGSPVGGSYSKWIEGEPSNFGGNENCGEMIVSGKRWLGEWNDINCSPLSFKHIFMCEKLP